MYMKIHNKGQVVIPAQIRKTMGIEIGDLLDVHFDDENKELHLRRVDTQGDQHLAGRFASYATQKPLPSTQETNLIFERTLSSQ